jgi:hypothetical protein
MRHRARTGREVLVWSAMPTVLARRTISHSIDATRYNIARSEGLRDRFCSRNKSGLRPKAATREATSGRTKSASCSSDDVRSSAKYANRMIESKIAKALISILSGFRSSNGKRRLLTAFSNACCPEAEAVLMPDIRSSRSLTGRNNRNIAVQLADTT